MNCKECRSPFYEDEQVFTGDQGWICKDCSDKRAEERFENADEEELLEYFRGSLNKDDIREMMRTVPDVKENFKDGYMIYSSCRCRRMAGRTSGTRGEYPGEYSRESMFL